MMCKHGEELCRDFCYGDGGDNFYNIVNATQRKLVVSILEMVSMKKIGFLFLVIFIFSCRKTEINNLKKEITGVWEIERFVGYPFTQPPYPSGNGQMIVIKKNGDFERWKHDTLVFEGHYFVQIKKDCGPSNNDIIFITNESYQGDYRYIDVEEGKLTLTTPNCWADGGTAYYRRVE
jgi:hypothetical protein